MPTECTCDHKAPRCPPCLMAIAVTMRMEHPDTLSVGMLRRRVPRLLGREAAILVEATRWVRIRREAKDDE